MNTKKYIISIILAIALTTFVTSLYFLKISKPSTDDPTPSLVENTPDKQVVFPQPTNDSVPITEAPVGTAFLFGQINNINANTSKIMIDIALAENEKGQDDQEQAALVDGSCTLDQIETDACLNNPFYIYKTGKAISLPLDKGADVEVYARDASGGMLVDKNSNIYLQKTTVQNFVDDYGNKIIDSGTSYIVATKGGIAIGLKEQYTP